ncbi:Metal dependent phosphohydrolase [Colletotrichum higginsianum IMI 349063]|uniref:Metal dependent phosphohydrolase n=1 Tax=Colletotrichum higginsianum (strain IMI 349063) TaxID=759273 RepID=A0A1B7YRN2_COLHI|nr:Metal dependent phosphohydrolase [Colletotrichum higginsianum IMI 349063]OBR14683.1 Metal dependent phosphohydrolase [Colletotrichum higginsianum IMI 349063]
MAGMGTIPAPLVQHLASLQRPPPQALGPEFFDIPQSPICQRAASFIRGWNSPWIANHCFRTYAFALAIAQYAGWDTGAEAEALGFDRELIFLACVMHEMGVHPGEALHSRLSLEIWGAIKAREWILNQTEEFVVKESRPEELLKDWADEVCEAIARHTIEFRGFSSRCRLTLALVALGSGQDLMGLSSAAIHADDIRTVCEIWPRSGYCQGLSQYTKQEVGLKPACLFDDCARLFDPQMFEVEVYRGMQGQLDKFP